MLCHAKPSRQGSKGEVVYINLLAIRLNVCYPRICAYSHMDIPNSQCTSVTFISIRLKTSSSSPSKVSSTYCPQCSLLLQLNIRGGEQSVKCSLVRLSKFAASYPDANPTSNSIITRATEARMFIRASGRPIQPYGPGPRRQRS